MRVELSFLHSKLARRIFWLFVLCALVPISLLAIVAWRNVTAQLDEQNRRQLRQQTRQEAMTIVERLVFLDGNLKLLISEIAVNARNDLNLSSRDAIATSSNLARWFDGVELVSPGGKHQPLFGKALPPVELTENEEKFLNAGNTVLSTMPCVESQAPCILLSRRGKPDDPSSQTLVAQIKPSYLWNAEDLSAEANTCVLDAAGRMLFCSAQAPPSFPSQLTKSFSGEFDWRLGATGFVAQYWNLPLSGSFFTPHWTVVVSQPRPDALAPLAHFRTSLILVFLLTVWVVLLLSLVQIRRNLVPLGKLKEGTRRISQGNFRERVAIESGDEFEELAASFNVMASRIEKQLHSLRTFDEIDRAILSAWDIDKIVDTLSTRLSELIPLDGVSVTLFDSEESPSACGYLFQRGGKTTRLKQKFTLTNAEAQKLRQDPEVSVTIAGEKLPDYLKPLCAKGMKFFLRIPIFLEGRPAAVICLGHSRACVWDEEDKQSARQLARQVGVALANSQLIHKLQQMHLGALSALARAIDAKSSWTLGHSERVTDFAIRLAEEMGLPAKELEIMRRGGLVHDVGKIGVPAEILDKPGKLTPQEMQQMRDHVNIGVRILEPIPGLAESMSIVAQHHEWVNGGGYPNGLKGEQISLHARILALADCFDALVSDRPYRSGIPVHKVVQMICEGAGKQFDPQIVEVFRRVMDQQGASVVKKDGSREVAELV